MSDKLILGIPKGSLESPGFQIPQENGHQCDRYGGGRGTDQKRRAHTPERPQQGGQPVKQSETGTKGGIVGHILDKGRQVGHAIGVKKKHGDDRSHGIQGLPAGFITGPNQDQDA